MEKSKVIAYFNSTALKRDYWRWRNRYYHTELEIFFSSIIPKNSSVLEIGSATGDLINKLSPQNGTGIDISERMVRIARNKYPHMEFYVDDIEDLVLDRKFDFVIMQDLIGHLSDVWRSVRNLQKITSPETRIISTYYNQLWEPIILLAEKLHLKMKQPYQNWLSIDDIENLLYLNDFEVISKGYRFLFPVYVPFISDFINKHVARIPFIRKLCLITFVIARKRQMSPVRNDYSCSVVIPCRNEVENIEEAVKDTPVMGKGTEIIFVDGNSTDGTIEKIEEMIKMYPQKKIKLIYQGLGKGKGDAVRKGFEAASGDVLMIMDADLTVIPEDLGKFYFALTEGKGAFINGTRLVYPMEEQAMRFLNYLGNKFFSYLFTWFLGQKINDTLCGTKVLFKKDYERIKEGRKFFGDFDPFGDFDLLFGAARLKLKIAEMPVRYRARKYGTTKISRFTHGWLLLKMSWIAFKKFKLRKTWYEETV